MSRGVTLTHPLEMVLLVQLMSMAKAPVESMSWVIDSSQRAIAGSKDYFRVMETEVESMDEFYKMERSLYEKPPEERDSQFQGLIDQFNNNTVESHREIWEVLQ